jgi:SAM-dependent methyltransferase
MTEARTAFTDEQYANPYPPGIEHHYWHLARNRILLRKLRPVMGPDTKVLDIGCGPGIVVDHLRRSGIDAFGVDLGSPRPATDRVASFLSLGMSAFALPASLRESVSILLLMDVLEHLPEPVAFLRECRRSFSGTRHVFVTLPARMELWSSYDEYYGHHRRYTLEALPEIASRADLRLLRSGYFFHSLYAAARVVLMGRTPRSHRVSTPSPRFAHAILGRLLAIEEAIVPRRVPGSSLYALFEAT